MILQIWVKIYFNAKMLKFILIHNILAAWSLAIILVIDSFEYLYIFTVIPTRIIARDQAAKMLWINMNLSIFALKYILTQICNIKVCFVDISLQQ